VKFEVRQLQIELSELDTLNRSSYERLKSLSLQLDSYSRLLRENNQKIQPYKNVLSIVTNEEIAIIDMERGKLNEKIENLIRIKDTVKEKNEISKRVDEITTEIKNIENIASTKMVAVNFSEIANDLEEAMNTYTSSLNTDSRNIWNQGRISCHLTAKGFNFYVGAKRWTALSATLKGYFLLAYHYALLRLSVMDKYNYPQLLILDFPVQFGKEEITSSSLNYLLEPFAELQELFPEKTQIIVAGRNFNIPNSSNEIYLRKVWE
jgi:hypothetical protein